jgi:DNA topoisomerase-1
LRRFYFGGEGTAGATGVNGTASEGLRALVDDLGEIDARDISTVPLGEDLVLRVGRYGPYVESTVRVDGEDPRRATVPDDIAPDELTPAKARELLEATADDGRVLGTDPVTGREIIARAGRYGPYVTEVIPPPPEPPTAAAAVADGDPGDDGGDGAVKVKPKKKAAKKVAAVKPRTGSLFADMSLDTITLDDALRLLSLPRVVGVDPESGDEITAQNGRYGPYLRKGTDSRSLEREDQLFSVTLDEALAIYAEPKRRGRQAAAPLAELGADPVSGKPIVVKDGRFGPYVTDGETNATLRKGDEPESVTLERAAELLADKRARGPAPKKRTVKKAAKKTAAKRTTKKAAAKR